MISAPVRQAIEFGVNRRPADELLARLSKLSPEGDEEVAWYHMHRAVLLEQSSDFRPTYDGYARVADELDRSGIAPGLRSDKIPNVAACVRRRQKFQKFQARAIKRGQPVVLLNAMQRSGSLFVSSVVSEILRMPVARVVWGNASINVVVPAWARALAPGGATTHNSIMPHSENIRRLAEAGLTKMVLQLRDPRQAAVSGAHMALSDATRVRPAGGDCVQLSPKVQTEAPTLACTEFISRHEFIRVFAKTLFDSYAEFIAGWWAHVTDSACPLSIHVLSYDALKANPRTTCKAALGFAGGKFSTARLDAALQKYSGVASPHWRKATLDEFRSLFAHIEQHEQHARIPAEASAMLGWKP